MTPTINPEKYIRDFVAEDFRTAAIFSKHKIDFCCRGDRSIVEVCKKKNIDLDSILSDLDRVINSASEQSIDYKSWPSDLLADYIQKKHHRYVTEKTPVLKQFLNKLCKVHGERHPELYKINELFTQSTNELSKHMIEEETVLFPYIRKMIEAKNSGSPQPTFSYSSVENPIENMLHEHDAEGERFREIARLTNDYTLPEDACNTYRVAFQMLEEFEKDLHLHIHLENNILFRDAVSLEKSF